MIYRITRQTHPAVFENRWELNLEVSHEAHRKASSMYRKEVITIDMADALWLKEQGVDDAERLIGSWETNMFVWSEIDHDESQVDEMYRVEKVAVPTFRWLVVTPSEDDGPEAALAI